jgi:hypothetical protein
MRRGFFLGFIDAVKKANSQFLLASFTLFTTLILNLHPVSLFRDPTILNLKMLIKNTDYDPENHTESGL